MNVNPSSRKGEELSPVSECREGGIDPYRPKVQWTEGPIDRILKRVL